MSNATSTNPITSDETRFNQLYPEQYLHRVNERMREPLRSSGIDATTLVRSTKELPKSLFPRQSPGFKLPRFSYGILLPLQYALSKCDLSRERQAAKPLDQPCDLVAKHFSRPGLLCYARFPWSDFWYKNDKNEDHVIITLYSNVEVGGGPPVVESRSGDQIEKEEQIWATIRSELDLANTPEPAWYLDAIQDPEFEAILRK